MPKRLVAPELSPDINAALEVALGSPRETTLLATPQYNSLVADDAEEELVPRAAREALHMAKGKGGYVAPRDGMPINPLATQEALTRQALYSVEERVYPRTNPNVTSFSAFDIPPSEAATVFNGSETTSAAKARRLNSLDEGQRIASCACWWSESEDRVTSCSQCPRMPVPPDPISIPPLGFPRPATDAQYHWNIRYLEVLNSRAGRQRDETASTFVKEFCDEVVPMLNFVLSNLTSLPSPLLHCRGVTIEVMGKSPHISSLFEGDRASAYKVANREYHARAAAQRQQLPQLIVPFTVMVELYGAKAVAYPRTPLAPRPQVGASAPQDGLAYGVRTDIRQFHSEYSLYNGDAEAESIARQLAKGMRAKPKYLGREFSSLQCSYTPVTFAIHRSHQDNRLYASQLLHLMSPTVNADTAFCNEYYVNTFRPEFVEKHQSDPLSFESCTHLQVVGKDADESVRMAAVQLLLTYVIPQAAQQFSRDIRMWGIGWPLMERGGLSRLMHSWGINMRYLVEFRNALRPGASNNQARSYVEIELVARALKGSILRSCSLYTKDGIAYPHEISNHIRRIVNSTIGALWETEVWPAIVFKYPILATEAWATNRVDWKRSVERLLALLGAQVRVNRVATGSTTSRVVYAPIVHVPPFPGAPYGDGETLNLALRARRYLRGVVAGTVTESAKQQAFLCVQLLQSGPEAGCEELIAYVAAEGKRKEKLRGRDTDGNSRSAGPRVEFAAAQLTIGSYNHIISLRDREGKLLFDTSPDALAIFGFQTQQRLQITLGTQKGRRCQVIGVRGGHLWRVDAGADQPMECTGSTHMDLMLTYGFVVFDDAQIEDPLLLPGVGTVLIYEQSRAVVEGRHGLAPGQQIIIKAPGPLQGTVTTIIGIRDGLLHHMPTASIGYPVPFAGEEVGAFSMGIVSLCSHPVEPTAIDSFTRSTVGDYFMGFKVTAPYGYHYRQVLYLQRGGTHAGHRACVLGVKRGQLWAALDYGELIALGDMKATIDEIYLPTILGLYSEDWKGTITRPNTTFYPTISGEPVTLSTSEADLLDVADMLLNSKLVITGGHRCGEVAAVVGVQLRNKKVWVQFEGEAGGVPLGTTSYVPIKGTSSQYRFEEGASTIPALSPCGTIIPISIEPSAASSCGLHYGQLITIERWHGWDSRQLERWEAERACEGASRSSIVEETLFATKAVANTKGPTRAVVIGVYRQQVWVQAEGCAYVWPLKGYSMWELWHNHGTISVAGYSPAAPWSDSFMATSDVPSLEWTSFDHLYKDVRTTVFTLKSGDPVGLRSTPAEGAFAMGSILKQRLKSNFTEDAVSTSPSIESTPLVEVVGYWEGVTYIEDYAPHEPASGIVRPLADPEAFEVITVTNTMHGPISSEAALTPSRAASPFIKQLGINGPYPQNASEGTCFALVDGNGSLFQAVPKEVVARATNFEHPEKLIFTEKGTYNFEAMTYRQYIVEFTHLPPASNNHSHALKEEVYAIVRINVFTGASVLAGIFGILPAWGLPLVEIVDGIANALIDQSHGPSANRAYVAQLLGLQGQAYFEDDVALWKDTLAECISELLILDLAAEGAEIPTHTVAEFRNMHQNFPPKGLHGCCAYVLSLIGCEEAALLHHYSLDQSMRMVLAVVRRCTGSLLGVVLTPEEYLAHLSLQGRRLEADEGRHRAHIEHRYYALVARMQTGPTLSLGADGRAIMDEAFEGDMDHWMATEEVSTMTDESQHAIPSAADGHPEPQKEPWQRLSRVRAEIEAMLLPTGSTGGIIRRLTTSSKSTGGAGHRFTEADASVLYLESASTAYPSYKRGDVVRYTTGDLNGMLATILGVRDSQLWRCEHSGQFQGTGLPFEGSEEQIVERFGPEVAKGCGPRLICGNVSVRLTWAGELKSFDVSHESCFQRYGVVVGQRFQATRLTPDIFPFQDFVIIIVGVLEDRLWFVCDQTGAIPFPSEIANPIRTFKLRLLYTAPIHPPANPLVKVQGSLTDSERNFLHDPGAHAMLFCSSPDLLSLQSPIIAHSRKVLITDPLNPKPRRATIVGVRLGQVWAIVEFDSFATALHSKTQYQATHEEETVGKIAILRIPEVPSHNTRRYPIPKGGLGLFSLEDTLLQYGVRPGQVVEWGAGTTRTTSLILGVRNGALWRVDNGEEVARPFLGRFTRSAIEELAMASQGTDSHRLRLRPW